MAQQSPDRVSRALLLAPLVFIAHWLEESPGFVPWFNAHVKQGITPELFSAVNATALLITILLTAAYWATRSSATAVLVIGWLSFLMVTNAVFHLTGAIVDGGYVPGLATALFLYLPYGVWVARRIMRQHLVAPGLAAAAAVLGAIPMAVHGYRILFLGTRLF